MRCIIPEPQAIMFAAMPYDHCMLKDGQYSFKQLCYPVVMPSGAEVTLNPVSADKKIAGAIP